MTASELHKKLVDSGIDASEADEMVKGRVEAGSVTPDGGYEDAVDPTVLEAATEAILKAVQPDITKGEDEEYEEDAEEEGEEEEEEEEGDADEDEATEKAEGYDIVAIISKGADQILDSVEQQNDALAKGYLAVGKLTQNMAKAVNKQAARLGDVEAKLDTILKALGQVQPPRSVMGDAAIIPAPGDGVEKGESKAAVVARAQELIQKETNVVRIHELGTAVAELDSGSSAIDVAQRYRI